MPSRLALLLLFTATLAACDGPSDPGSKTGPAAAVSVIGSATRAGAAGLTLADSLAIRVTDAAGNPVAGHPLVWSVVSGGGSISGSATTDANGIGRAAWTLGPDVGTAQVARVFAGVSLTVDFVATASLPPGATIQVVSGNGQTGTVGQALADSLVVSVSLPDGRPAVGVPVQWQPSGNGSVSATLTATGANGRAAVRWTLGTAAGGQSLAALVAGTPGAAFLATAKAGPAVALAVVGAATRTGMAGLPVADSLAVRVTDAAGNPVSGHPLAWSVVSGGGSISGSAATDANGIGKASWTLGPEVGTQQVARASAGGSLTADFAATASLPPGSILQVVSGNGQTGTVGQALADSLVVSVSLPDGRPAVGVPVQWQPGSGSVSAAATPTGADGRAAVRWTLGTVAGAQSAAALAGGASVTFQATAQAGPAVEMVPVSGDGQGGSRGQPLPAPLVVELRDAFGNPVPGATVGWAVLSGGGSVSPPASATDASGRARTAWTLSADGAPGSVRASSPGTNAVTFTSPGAPPPAAVQPFSGDGQSAPAGSALLAPLSARVVDAGGSPLSGVPVSWTVVSGHGKILGSTATTDASGIAQATWELGAELGTSQRVDASVAGVAAPATFTATATAPTSVVVTKVAGDGQTQTIQLLVPVVPTVRVTLADGRPLRGAPVTWTPSGTSTVSAPSGTTDANGEVKTAWRMGQIPGGYSVTAGTPGGSATFTATAVTPLSIYAGNNQASVVNVPFDTLVVRVARANGTPLTGVTVNWTCPICSSGTYGLTPPSSVTDANGLARTRFSASQNGTYRVRAQTPEYPYAEVYFDLKVVPPVLVKVSGDNQSTPAGSMLPNPLRVRLTHADGRPLAGVRINFNISSTAGTASPVAVDTDVDGYALSNVTLGPTAGVKTITVYTQAYLLSVTFKATATPP